MCIDEGPAEKYNHLIPKVSSRLVKLIFPSHSRVCIIYLIEIKTRCPTEITVQTY